MGVGFVKLESGIRDTVSSIVSVEKDVGNRLYFSRACVDYQKGSDVSVCLTQPDRTDRVVRETTHYSQQLAHSMIP